MISGLEDSTWEAHLAALNAVYVILVSGKTGLVDLAYAPKLQRALLQYVHDHVDEQLQELVINGIDGDELQLAIYFTVCAILASLRGRHEQPDAAQRRIKSARSQDSTPVLAETPLVHRIFSETINSIDSVSCAAIEQPYLFVCQCACAFVHLLCTVIYLSASLASLYVCLSATCLPPSLPACLAVSAHVCLLV